jgi:hypothetical protein
MQRRTLLRSGLVLGAAAVVAPRTIFAQTPAASPEADAFPEGPLGEQAQWILEVANAGPGSIKAGEIESHFHISYFEETSMSEIFTLLSDLQSAGITYEIDFSTFITTMDLPASNGRFIMIGSDGSETEVSIQIDRESGLIVGLYIGPVGGAATPEASPVS